MAESLINKSIGDSDYQNSDQQERKILLRDSRRSFVEVTFSWRSGALAMWRVFHGVTCRSNASVAKWRV